MYKVLHALNIPIHVQEVGLVGLRGGGGGGGPPPPPPPPPGAQSN